MFGFGIPGLFMVLGSLLPVAVFAQWAQTNGPIGPSVRPLATDGVSLFASTNVHGVIQLRDLGGSWQSLSLGREGSYLGQAYALAARGDTVYASDPGGIRIHAGGGAGWRLAKPGWAAGTWATDLAFGFGGLLAMTSDGGLFRSVDGGADWARLDTGAGTWLTSWRRPALALDGDCAYMAGLLGVRRSLDRGHTWSVGMPIGADTVIVVACNPPYVFALTPKGLYRSKDSAANWSRLGLGIGSNIGTFRSLDAIGGRLYAVRDTGGLFTSVDNGMNWSQDSGFFGSRGPLLEGPLIAQGSDLIAGTLNGAFRSSDQGHTWSAIDAGIGTFMTDGLVSDGRGRLAALQDFNIYTSDDLGTYWNGFRIPQPNVSVDAIGAIDGNLFAVNLNSGIFLSRNVGRDWELAVPSNQGWYHAGRFFALGRDMYYANPFSDSLALILLDPDGNGRPALPGWKGGRPESMTSCGGLAYAIVSDSVRRYDPERNEWRPTASMPSGKAKYALGSQGSAVLVGTIGNGLFRSADSGRTWSRILDSAVSGQINVLLEAGEYVYAGTKSGVAFSRNGGPWRLLDRWLDDPVMGRNVFYLTTQSGYLFAGLQIGGIWKYPLDGIEAGIGDRPVRATRKAPAKWTQVAGTVEFPVGPDGLGSRDARGRSIGGPGPHTPSPP